MAAKGDTLVVVPRNETDLQRMRLDKLMKNPTKEIVIQEKSKEWTPRDPQEFIRNVWGSSAGAGSGDFHVYRGVRRREYARQKFITEKADRDGADVAYHKKVEENQKAAADRTSKKRAKRDKKKQKLKNKKQKQDHPAIENTSEEDSDDRENV